MIRAALLVFGLWTLFLSGMMTFIRRDAVEPYYLEFQTFEPGSGAVEACLLFYFHRPLECQPLWFNQIATRSPDGRAWVFPSFAEPRGWAVYRALDSGTTLEELYRSSNVQIFGIPILSPDGRFFVVSGPEVSPERDIFRVELATGEVIPLNVSPGDQWLPAWSFDGQRIAFNGRASPEEPARIFTMRADGSGVQDIGLQSVYGPAWSPDSEWIIFQSGCTRQVLLLPDKSPCPEFNFDLYRVNLTDGQINTVAALPGNDFSPAYSPDDEWVAFVSTVDSTRQIYRVRPDGSDLQQLTNDDHNYFPPSWVKTPDFVWRPIFLGMTALVCVMIGWHRRS